MIIIYDSKNNLKKVLDIYPIRSYVRSGLVKERLVPEGCTNSGQLRDLISGPFDLVLLERE